jgi:hypothetical protein
MRSKITKDQRDKVRAVFPIIELMLEEVLRSNPMNENPIDPMHPNRRELVSCQHMEAQGMLRACNKLISLIGEKKERKTVLPKRLSWDE